MSFGMFGSIFFLAQFLQTVQHLSPLAAGLRTLPWTGMPILVAPLAGLFVERVGGRALIAIVLGLQATGLAWIAVVIAPGTPYADVVPAFILSGIGMSLFFRPGCIGGLVLGAAQRRRCLGTNNAVRELGGVFGIALLGAVFASFGGYATGATYVAGLLPALRVGTGVLAAGALLALSLPQTRSALKAEQGARLEAA